MIQQVQRPTRTMLHKMLLLNSIAMFLFVLVSLLLYVILRTTIGPQRFGLYTLIGLLSLDCILLEAALYWFLKYRGLFERLSLTTRLLLFRVLYPFNWLLMAIGPAIVLIEAAQGRFVYSPDFILGLLLFVFGLGEFINYCYFKINMSREEKERMAEQRRRPAGRLMREKQRVEQRLRANTR
ncbi:hypothetical protein EI42_06268 [Thermosporothrix hazakensis]|uniref:Uncharacterized protein n=2 Tax=Thermosporothrix TaxID=768650 RepID=A0A326TPD9_THEHA|nr:hypothetical protein EI42_06268 [Thermosporothrix hazakensis]